jgi:two-component system LytT family response regulator
MKPPADGRFATDGAGIDLPAPARLRYGVQWPFILTVATLLGVGSSVLAWQFTLAIGKPVVQWRSLVVLHVSYWYVWAVFTPAVVWLSQHFRLERQGLVRAALVHMPSVALFSLAHIAAMAGVQWWLAATEGRSFSWWIECKRSALDNFDWEMMTYWAIAGLSHAVLYYRESRDRELRTSQLETKLISAQMAALQRQLQPHFLFNTLHAISALMHRDVEAADRTLMRLSDLLRMALESVGHQEIALKAELEFLAKYLEIEQTRFADRLVVRFDIEPDTLDTRVPTLLLQPLVENAIKHGVSKKAGPGHIDISARREHDKLRIEVRDDGVGLSETALTALQKGIGVSTTRARLQHQFGADYRFEFHRQAQGLAVVVALPWRLEVVTPSKDSCRTTNRTGRRATDPVGAIGGTPTPQAEALSPLPAAGASPWDDDMKKIRTLVVDDEPLARERLTALLAGEPDIEVVGQCRDGEEAITSIIDQTPDLVFLDVQMPQLNGFEVIEAVGSERMPLVIFVTAYDQHALRAFQVRALDYLLKPFDRERFSEALQRARKQIERDETGDLGRRLLALVKDLRKDQPRADRLVVKSGGRLFFLRADEIDWVEAAGNYVRLHVGPTAHLLRETMNAIEGRLDPEKFFRIHRSRIVNMERIQELQPWLNGEYSVLLRTGTRLTLSRGYREKLQDRLKA